jgi:genome maintenance exonuclease 1
MTPAAERIRALPRYELTRETNEDGDRIYATPLGPCASVTAILSGSRDQSGLQLWRESVGETKAQEIVDLACFRGTRHHEAIERFLEDGTEPQFDFLNTPFWKSSRTFLDCIDQVLLSEGSVWHPEGYAGAFDCVAYLHDDEAQPTLCDWKTANRPCKPDKLYDYSLQCAAYVAAANHVYGHLGLNIQRAVIVVAIPDEKCQIEWIDANALRQLYRHFLARKQRFAFARSRGSKR